MGLEADLHRMAAAIDAPDSCIGAVRDESNVDRLALMAELDGVHDRLEAICCNRLASPLTIGISAAGAAVQSQGT
jgi:hypothetical protein